MTNLITTIIGGVTINPEMFVIIFTLLFLMKRWNIVEKHQSLISFIASLALAVFFDLVSFWSISEVASVLLSMTVSQILFDKIMKYITRDSIEVDDVKFIEFTPDEEEPNEVRITTY